MTTATVTSDLGYRPNFVESTSCFAHYHLTMEEYGLWTHARQLAHESGIFYFDGRKVAGRFGQTKKDAAYRVGKNLIRKGWLAVIRKPKRLKNGMFSPGEYRPVSHDEWAAAHPGACLEIQTGIESASLENQNDLSGNPERPVWKSRHNMKGLNRKGEYDTPAPSSEPVQVLGPLDSSNSKSKPHTRDEDGESKLEDPEIVSIPSESQREDSKRESAAPDEDAILARVWDHYLTVTGRDSVTNTLTAGRRKLGKARLRDCLKRVKRDYDKAEQLLKLTIDGIGRDDWAMGRNPKTNGKSYCDWERHVFRSEEMMERLWNM